ncbi:MAG: DUF4402 domain-containing protein [Alphaproteobacteria bacterium]|nr:DUF4402 domain-containing protein [Alphaproteobacteria bacterium]MBN2780038.1 DUF4402 domain-containing protein [Alphaproteobacteria bacterium]
MFKLTLFILGLILGSSAYAATGTGHAQAILDTPLSVTSVSNIDFGTIAIDPAAGPQAVTMTCAGWVTNISCPATYVCSGGSLGMMEVTGANGVSFTRSISGSTAVLSDGKGNTIPFVPKTLNGPDVETFYFELPVVGMGYCGTLYLNGDEPAGAYNTTNAGGSGFTVTVNY